MKSNAHGPIASDTFGVKGIASRRSRTFLLLYPHTYIPPCILARTAITSTLEGSQGDNNTHPPNLLTYPRALRDNTSRKYRATDVTLVRLDDEEKKTLDGVRQTTKHTYRGGRRNVPSYPSRPPAFGGRSAALLLMGWVYPVGPFSPYGVPVTPTQVTYAYDAELVLTWWLLTLEAWHVHLNSRMNDVHDQTLDW